MSQDLRLRCKQKTHKIKLSEFIDTHRSIRRLKKTFFVIDIKFSALSFDNSQIVGKKPSPNN